MKAPMDSQPHSRTDSNVLLTTRRMHQRVGENECLWHDACHSWLAVTTGVSGTSSNVEAFIRS